ncbi:MAG: hypothetical protein ACRDTN_16215, partial [Mycobacterium sp.]
MATTTAAGALAMVLMASDTAAVSDPPTTMPASALAVVLTSGSSNPFQPEIDQLLAAQQQVADTNSNYPFIVPTDLPMLHEYTQNLALLMLGTQLHTLSGAQSAAITFIPY